MYIKGLRSVSNLFIWPWEKNEQVRTKKDLQNFIEGYFPCGIKLAIQKVSVTVGFID